MVRVDCWVRVRVRVGGWVRVKVRVKVRVRVGCWVRVRVRVRFGGWHPCTFPSKFLWEEGTELVPAEKCHLAQFQIGDLKNWWKLPVLLHDTPLFVLV